MTRTGRDLQREKLGHRQLQCSELFFFCALVSALRASEREDESELHSAFLLCYVFPSFLLDFMSMLR